MNISQLYSRYHWMFSATAYNHAYIDSGIFCIHASAPPNHLRDMLEVIIKEMVTMGNAITDEELRVIILVNSNNCNVVKKYCLISTFYSGQLSTIYHR